MKVLFISFWYPTETRSLFGAFIKQYAVAIKDSGCDIMVISINCADKNTILLRKKIFTDEFRIETHSITLNPLIYKTIYYIPYIGFLFLSKYIKKKVLPNFVPNVIHSNIIQPTGIIGFWLSKKFGIKHILTEHWSRVDNYMNRNIFSLYAQKAYEQCVAVTVVSNYLKKSISKYITDVTKIHIIPNIIRTNIFTYKPKIKTENKINFTAIAEWEPPKAPELFLNALNKISKDAKQDFSVYIIGNGSQLEVLKKQSYNFKIIFTGKLDWLEISPILHKTDYFLHSSYMETFSIVIAEALCTGTPVIASKVGAIGELINNDNGILCENTIEGWTQGINKALLTSFDSEQISKSMENKYSVQAVGRQIRSIYEKYI